MSVGTIFGSADETAWVKLGTIDNNGQYCVQNTGATPLIMYIVQKDATAPSDSIKDGIFLNAGQLFPFQDLVDFSAGDTDVYIRAESAKVSATFIFRNTLAP